MSLIKTIIPLAIILIAAVLIVNPGAVPGDIAIDTYGCDYNNPSVIDCSFGQRFAYTGDGSASSYKTVYVSLAKVPQDKIDILGTCTLNIKASRYGASGPAIDETRAGTITINPYAQGYMLTCNYAPSFSSPTLPDYIVNLVQMKLYYDGSVPVEMFCGDNVCNNGETVQTCPLDCQDYSPPEQSIIDKIFEPFRNFILWLKS